MDRGAWRDIVHVSTVGRRGRQNEKHFFFSSSLFSSLLNPSSTTGIQAGGREVPQASAQGGCPRRVSGRAEALFLGTRRPRAEAGGRRALVPRTAGRESCWLPEEAPSARPATPGPRSSVSESRQRAGRRAAGLRAACLSSWARDVPRASALTAAHIRGGWGRRCIQAAAPGSGLTWAARGERPAAGRSLCLLSSLRTLRTRPGSQRAGR